MDKPEFVVEVERLDGKWTGIGGSNRLRYAVDMANDLVAIGFCARVTRKRTVIRGGCREHDGLESLSES